MTRHSKRGKAALNQVASLELLWRDKHGQDAPIETNREVSRKASFVIKVNSVNLECLQTL